MAHQGPSRNEFFVKLNSSHEVESTLLMVTSQAVIISDHAAGLWPILVILEYIECQISQLSIVLLDVKYV